MEEQETVTGADGAEEDIPIVASILLEEVTVVGELEEDENRDQYGNTLGETVSNPYFWFDFIFNEGAFETDPKFIQLSFADNPISLLVPFAQFSKASIGLKTAGSKTTLVTSNLYKDLGARGSLGGQWFTPYGPASNWETFLGRWSPFFMESDLIYYYTKKLKK